MRSGNHKGDIMRSRTLRLQDENAAELKLLRCYILNNVIHIQDYYSPVLGEFELLVLLSLLYLGNGAYGASIQRDIRERAGRDAAAGTLYMTLSRLEAKQMVVSYVGDPTAARGGRRRKHYVIADTGERALGRAYRTFRQMSAGLEDQLEAL